MEKELFTKNAMSKEAYYGEAKKVIRLLKRAGGFRFFSKALY